MPKISALTALPGASISSSDNFVVEQASGPTTKRMTADQILKAAFAAAGKAALDENGNTWFSVVTTASAVNFLTFTNAATGNGATLSATGSDTNIDLLIKPKGTGGAKITSTGANALAVGANGSTNPALQVDASAGSPVTGWKATANALASGAALAVISSGANEAGTIDAKGNALLSLQTVGTGDCQIGTNLRLTSAKAIVDANGNAVVKLPATVASAVNQLTVTNSATGNAVSLTATGSDTNIDLSLGGKGTGATRSTTGLLSSSATVGIGYATGAGGTVTQLTSRTTGVTINKLCGQITLFSAAGSATPFTFTVTNSTVAATDTIDINQATGTDAYQAIISGVGAGSFKVTITDLTGTTTEAPVFNFNVQKGVTS